MGLQEEKHKTLEDFVTNIRAETPRNNMEAFIIKRSQMVDPKSRCQIHTNVFQDLGLSRDGKW